MAECQDTFARREPGRHLALKVAMRRFFVLLIVFALSVFVAPVAVTAQTTSTTSTTRPPSSTTSTTTTTTTVPVGSQDITGLKANVVRSGDAGLVAGFGAYGPPVIDRDVRQSGSALPDLALLPRLRAVHLNPVGGVGIDINDQIIAWDGGGNPNTVGTASLGVVPGAVQVVGSRDRAYVRTSSGDLWVYGDNIVGVLGTGTTTRVSSFTKITSATGMNSIVDVAQGSYRLVNLPIETPIFAAAIDSAGDLWMWGDNSKGQFGDGTTIGSLVPRKIPRASGMGPLAKIFIPNSSNTVFAVTRLGELWSWGDDTDGMRGDGLSVTPTNTPPTRVAISAKIRTATQISSRALAVDTQGACGSGGLHGSTFRHRLRQTQTIFDR